MRRRAAWTATAFALASLTVSGSASAATTIGQTGTPTGCGPGSFTAVQAMIADPPSYTVPDGGGVITSWATRGGSATGVVMRLKLYRPTADPTSFTAVGESSLEQIMPSTLNSFQTRIPVSGGEILGLSWFSFMSPPCSFTTSSGGDQVRTANGDPSAGTTTSFPGSSSSARVNASAVLEPDCDADGFGDETQDNDLSPCPPAPETTITKGPKDKTKKKTATFEFTADDPAATFECSLDGAAFAACASPETVKVKKGKHSFEVRAKDAGNNLDGSPASDDWKVKKRKRKR